MTFLAVFRGGPVHNRVFRVRGEGAHPARFQEIRKPINNRHGLPTGRVGVFVYRLTSTECRSDEVWAYGYLSYGEAFAEV